MKIKRYKKVHKHLGFFVNNYGFRQPYQLLVDGTFCYAALNNKINIADNIPRYLQGEIKLITTQCAIMEMENLGPKLNGALIILKKYTVHKCGHAGKPVTGSECLLSMVGKANLSHYIIATQDRDLQGKVADIPGVPIVYLHDKTPVLQSPSPETLRIAKAKLSGISEYEKACLQELQLKNGIENIDEKPKKKKKKGPNPLSCKKKKKKDAHQNTKVNKETAGSIDKTRRKKIRIPKHVKEELKKTKLSSPKLVSS